MIHYQEIGDNLSRWHSTRIKTIIKITQNCFTPNLGMKEIKENY